MAGNGGLKRDQSALAFKRIQHGGLFAADIGIGAHAHFQVECLAAAQYILAQVAIRLGQLYGPSQDVIGQWIF